MPMTLSGIPPFGIGMAAPAKAIEDVGQRLQQARAVAIILYDGLSGIPPTRDMVDGHGIFDA